MLEGSQGHAPIVHRPVRPYPTPTRPVVVPFPAYGSYAFPYSSFGYPYGNPLYFGSLYANPFFDNEYLFGAYGYDYGLSPYSLQANPLVEDLNIQVQQLQQEDDALRQQLQQHAATSQLPAQEQPSSKPAVPLTVLVFRDGHQLEVGNYAIVGDTLWILTDQRATKVPLSDLNLERTIHANQERGIPFPVPAAAAKP